MKEKQDNQDVPLANEQYRLKISRGFSRAVTGVGCGCFSFQQINAFLRRI